MSIWKGFYHSLSSLIAGILERNGHSVRYYRNDDREVEFVVESDAGVVPIEVKSGNSSTISLDSLLRQDGIPYGYKLIDGNVGVVGKKVTLPHYLAMFI